MDNEEDYVIIWEAPVLVPPEFRLYYDDKGKVVCYTCEDLEGDYIIIGSQTYAEMRYDIRVVEGKIIPEYSSNFISRLFMDAEGVMCEEEDLSIVAETSGQHWKLKTLSM